MISIENDELRVELKREGAEMTALYDKKTGRQCLWTADPAVWDRHAPVLFPVVGMCKNKQYRYQGKTYPMGQHGFARDRVFSISEQGNTKVVFELRDDEETYQVYPFHFILRVGYQLKGKTLAVTYQVTNTDKGQTMYFSIGGHPGFLYDGALEDQEFRFNSDENLDRLVLNGSAFSRTVKKDYVRGGQPIAITKDIFNHDALVFHNFKFTKIDLVNRKTGSGVEMDLTGFPYVGLWSKPGAPYACIEPWYGLADYEDFEGEISQKDGIMALEPEQTFRSQFTITIIA